MKVDEAARLEALASYDILDTPAESDFDEIAFIASRVCETPVALVSLVEAHRQWFKARVGVDMCETPITQSVCAHGLSSTELLIIPDLTQDERTKANTLVTEGPEIRFYAGAPLMTRDGHVIGMLCVIDTKPRAEGLSEDQATILTYLARQVVHQLDLRKVVSEGEITSAILRDDSVRARQAQAAGNIGTFEVDVASGMIRVSPEFCRLFGLPVKDIYTTAETEALVDLPDAGIRSTEESRVDGSAELTVEYRIRRPIDGAQRWIERRAEFIRDANGAVTHMIGVVQDVTDQRTINDEVGHRLKNTLSMVQAIAAHTLREVPTRAPVQEFDRRLHALSTAHDVLMQRSRSAAPLRQLARAALASLGAADRTDLDGPLVEITPQGALVVSMLLHELATNAMKYGALSVDGGRVSLAWRIEGDDLALDWIEQGGPPAEMPTKKGLGSRLIARGLGGGSTDLDYGANGFNARFRTPLADISA